MRKFAKKPLRLCVAMLYIALACTCAFSSVLSYYSITKTAEASAQVKVFGVDATITANTNVKLKPGGSGDLASVSVSGTPSVDATVTYKVTSVTLGNWAITGNTFYCPLVINVFGTEINGADSKYSGNKDAFIEAIKGVTYATSTLPADIPLDAHTKTVTWSWPTGTATASDSLLTTAATINITVTAIIEQVH